MLLACVIMIYNGPIVYSVHSRNLVRKKKILAIRLCVSGFYFRNCLSQMADI